MTYIPKQNYINFPATASSLIPTPSSGSNLFFSNDGRTIARYADGTLRDLVANQYLIDVGTNMWNSDSTRPSFSEQHFTVVAPAGGLTMQLSVNIDPTFDPSNFWPNMHEVGVRIDGSSFSTYSINNTLGNSTYEVVIPVGAHTVILRDGSKNYTSYGNIVKTISASAPLTPVSQTAPLRRLVILGDSIGTGFLCDHPTTDAWPLLIRDAGIWATTTHTGGGWALSQFASNPTQINSIISTLTPCFDGTQLNVLYIALGYNDAYGQLSSTAYGIYLSNLIDAVHAALPNVVVILQSPITANIETFGAVTLTQYRSAVHTIASARYPWCLEINGATDITAALSLDGVHPTTVGNITYASSVVSKLPWDPMQETGIAGFYGSSFGVAGSTDIYGLHNLTMDVNAALIANDSSYGNQPTLNMAGGAYGHTSAIVQSQPITRLIIGQTDSSATAAFVDDTLIFNLVGAVSGGVGVYDGSGWAFYTPFTTSTKHCYIVNDNAASTVIYADTSAAPIVTGQNPGTDGLNGGILLGKRHDTSDKNNGKIAACIYFTGNITQSKAAKIFQWSAFKFGATWS